MTFAARVVAASICPTISAVVCQYTKPNIKIVQIANPPDTTSVQRNVVVRLNSGRRTDDKAFAAHVVNHGWFARPIHLAPQPAHVNVDQIALRDKLVVPNFLEEHGSREQLLLTAHHVFEKTEFARKEINRTGTSLCSASQQIEFQWPNTQRRIDALRR